MRKTALFWGVFFKLNRIFDHFGVKRADLGPFEGEFGLILRELH